MTFLKVLCPNCRGKLEQGQRIHPACIDLWLEAQAAKANRRRPTAVARDVDVRYREYA